MSTVVPVMKALIVKDSKFLIVKDLNDNKWELPGGKVDYNEDPNLTLKREIKEELGVDVEIKEFVGMCYLILENEKRESVINVFRCNPSSYNFNLEKNPADEDLGELKFVSKEEFLSSDYDVYHISLKELIKKISF